MKTDVLIIGELLADLITEIKVDTLKQAGSFSMVQGGSAANLARALHYKGKKVQLVAAVGEDPIGDFLLQKVAENGLETHLISRIPGIPTSVVLVSKSAGTPDFLAYRMADIYLSQVDKALLRQTRIIHTSAFALSESPAFDVIMDALRESHKIGVQLSVDWNFAPQLWHCGNPLEVFEEICSWQPLLKMSMDDYRRFSGNSFGTERDAIRFLSRYKTKVTVLTCGATGSWYTEDFETWMKINPPEVKQVIDATGAGDAYWGGFLSGWLENRGVKESLEEGARLAGIKLTQGELIISDTDNYN